MKEVFFPKVTSKRRVTAVQHTAKPRASLPLKKTPATWQQGGRAIFLPIEPPSPLLAANLPCRGPQNSRAQHQIFAGPQRSAPSGQPWGVAEHQQHGVDPPGEIACSQMQMGSSIRSPECHYAKIHSWKLRWFCLCKETKHKFRGPEGYRCPPHTRFVTLIRTISSVCGSFCLSYLTVILQCPGTAGLWQQDSQGQLLPGKTRHFFFFFFGMEEKANCNLERFLIRRVTETKPTGVIKTGESWPSWGYKWEGL